MIFCMLFAFNIVIARKKSPEGEVEVRTGKAQKSVTRRKIKSETEVEKEKKKMIKTNENR